MRTKEKIIVGMSGGVDSSVAALLLIEQGYRVEGLFMKNWEEDDTREYCSATVDLADAQSVADQLGIRLHTINFSGEYWDHVFEYFLAEYRAGRTPNPDVLCNREIKFKAFLDYALHLGADAIATGHYSSIDRQGDAWRMLRARDENKDQTYFLYMLGQAQLGRSRFPLGDLEKPEVRRIAEQAGLPNHKKKDSTGICFIGERKFSEFLSRYLPASPGQMVTPEGAVVGEHQGLMYYTLGQRKGLGIGGRADSAANPWFVIDKNLAANRLIVAQGHDHPLLLKQGLEASQLHWAAGTAPALPVSCLARIRHRQPLQACTLSALENGHVRVLFNKKQRAVTPGQSVVFYQDRVCLGGGIIEQAFE
ncbi:tRNA 2-thiouridine(34) synthase MnmA [Sedimenticola hydrogenitrophicus]|uniref:tRNA 2-thiouridine(34) synthase MnmA n=1 Tax=Sedimenticola hydrogenitrophicus TaxID=2967975 RepID=UPI0021A423C7|nr:tRNA 2-thiouridine(34) synthase MnmA [Sedimenticola hydrogenitrophicus]